MATYSNGTTADVTDAPTTLWSDSNPSILAPAPTPSPSPGEYLGVCLGTSVIVASITSGVTSQQVSVSVTGQAPSGCPTPTASSTTAAEVRTQLAPEKLFTLRWALRVDGPVESILPSSSSKSVYITSNNTLYATDLSGKILWRRSINSSTIAVGPNQLVYAVTAPGVIDGIEAGGLTVWQANINGDVLSLVSGSDGSLYVGTTSGVFAFGADGSFLWSVEGVQPSVLAASPSGGLIVGALHGSVEKLDNNGKHLWSFTPPGGFEGSLTVDQEGNVYGSSGEGTVYALDPEGRLSWQFKAPYVLAGPVLGPDGTVDFVADELYAVSATGELTWTSKLTNGGQSKLTLIATSSAAVVGDSSGVITIVSPNSAQSTLLEINGSLSSIATGLQGELYIGSNNGYLYQIK